MSTTDHSFASTSVSGHLRRGLIGWGAVAVGAWLWSSVGMVGLLALPIAFVAFRGCPACWCIGLVQTLTRSRWRAECVDGECRLEPNRATTPG